MRHRRFLRIVGAAGGIVVLFGSCERAALDPAGERQELRLELIGADSVIEDGDSVSLGARVITKSGVAVDPNGFSFEWSLGEPEVAAIGGEGDHITLVALAPGEADLNVQAHPHDSRYHRGSMSVRRRFTVRPRPQRIEVLSGADQVGTPHAVLPHPIVVRLLDRGGRPLASRPIHFRPDSGGSVSPGTATTDAEGTARALWTLPPGTGDRALVVSSAGVPNITVGATAVVDQTPPPVHRVVVTPDLIKWDAIGERVTLSATAYDTKDRPITGMRFRWRASDANIASVDTMGRVTAHGIGAALIIASAVCCAKADTTGIEISQRVESITLSPDELELEVGSSATLRASARDGNQNPVQAPSLAWSSSNSSVASVSDGVVTGVAAGSAFILAVAGEGRDSIQVTVSNTSLPPAASLDNECAAPGLGWIWCDDFSQNRSSSYFEYDNANGRFVRESGAGINGTSGMRANFASGESNAGSLKLAFGRTPSPYFDPVDAGDVDHREIYWRVFVRNAPGWTGGGGDKLSRAVVFANSDWAEAAIGHVWSGGNAHNYLLVDPASGTDDSGNLRTTRYNDFDNLRWLGSGRSNTAIFSGANIGQWHCVETRMRLNDPGQSNGIFQLWIDGDLEADRTDLNWLGSYNAYGINALFLENYWNDGAPQQQTRYFDNLVVSTRPIGCGSGAVAPPPPSAPVPVASISVTPTSATVAIGESRSMRAVVRDAAGNELTDRRVTWASSATNVATVSSSGVVTSHSAGQTVISATAEGITGSARVTVSAPISAEPWVALSFDRYRDTEELLSDCTTWNCALQAGTGSIAIDTNVPPPGGTRSMRYHYRHSGDGCNSITIKRTLPTPALTQEVWAEFQVRWSDNFRTTNTLCSPNDHKLIFGDTEARENGRWAFYVGAGSGPDHSIMVERPLGPEGALGAYYLNRGEGLRARDLWDGEWHTIRLYYRASTGPTTRDGAMKVWVDGRLIHDESGFSVQSEHGGRDYIEGFSFAHNKDDGPPNEDMYLWWGSVTYWRQDPGW